MADWGSAGAGQFGQAGGGPFQASFQLTVTRPRPVTIVDPLGGGTVTQPAKQENLTANTSFSPTPFWSVSASSQYDIVANKFASYSVALQRSLHEWKAAFTFTQNANMVAETGGNATLIVDSDNTTLALNSGLEAKISDRLSTRLSYALNYDSNPPPQGVSTDTMTRFTMVYGF